MDFSQKGLAVPGLGKVEKHGWRQHAASRAYMQRTGLGGHLNHCQALHTGRCFCVSTTVAHLLFADTSHILGITVTFLSLILTRGKSSFSLKCSTCRGTATAEPGGTPEHHASEARTNPAALPELMVVALNKGTGSHSSAMPWGGKPCCRTRGDPSRCFGSSHLRPHTNFRGHHANEGEAAANRSKQRGEESPGRRPPS